MNHHTEERVNSMLIANKDRREYYLFYDIFIHWTGKKITATAPYYGDDINWKEHGIDLNNIVLTAGNVRLTANYIPHRLDSWEPAILFDFESPELLDLIRNSRLLPFTVTAGPHQQTFTIDCCPTPDHSVAMSVIIRDENQWIKYYLDYYFQCLDVSHIFVYDNYTADRHRLHEILKPYISLGKITYIPWHHRWRNQIDKKQIGQPPQQSHTLNRYGATPWIGFLDVDEFLRIPGKTLPEFLAQHNPDEIDGLSFDIRWFMYKGNLNIQAIHNPLFSFFHCKPDKLGRKRQKLMVSARHVRFLRFHWLEEGKRELQITDPNIFFHHYYVQRDRFERGKLETDTTYDDYMLRFRSVHDPTGDSPQRLPNINKKENKSNIIRNKDYLIRHVEEAFSYADNEKSKLNQDILDLYGMCGSKNRHLLNNLCNFEGCKYIEIGSLAGASLCSAMFGNSISATAIDNWSQFGEYRNIFFENINKHLSKTDLTVIEKDCFALDPATLPFCNVFYYDGEHSKENQYRAIKYFHPLFEEYTILIVDDWNWEEVRQGTIEAIADIGLNIIYEKEIILPQDDVKGMPRHKSSKTWWNGIYVAILETNENYDSFPFNNSHPSNKNASVQNHIPIEIVIFSKDRACQLDALLRSMDQFFEMSHRRTVIYTASSIAYYFAYKILINDNPNVTFIKENNFKQDLLKTLGGALDQRRHIMFLVDDLIFIRTYRGGKNLQDFSDNDGILTLSLRLGQNITYCHPRDMNTVPHDFSESNTWQWREAHAGYWNYPMSIDGHIFRADDIVSLVENLDFHNPSTLEAALACNPIQKPLMLAEREPYLVNLALNRVQDTFNNRCGDISAGQLNSEFLNGEAIDINPIINAEYASCHITPAIRFISGKKIGTNPESG